MISIIYIAIGLLLLVKGADWLVDGAISIAKRKNISDMVIGLTIVAFGTSLPELTVNLLASFQGDSDIAIGNVLGSNICNVLLILGITAIIKPLRVQKTTLYSDVPFSLIAALAVGFLANTMFLAGEEDLTLSRLDGVILISFFTLFMGYIVMSAREEQKNTVLQEPSTDINEISTKKAYLFIGGGILAMTFGGKLTVDGAVQIASLLNVSESLIGLTVVAIGTSLPELITSVVAARKGSADLAIGNVIGSNIFNIFWILGLSAIIKPLTFHTANNIDILMIVGSSFLIYAALIMSRKWTIQRSAGIIYVLAYIAYVTYTVIRG